MASIIERTNVKRGTKNQPPLTDKEIDHGIDQMIVLKVNNTPLNSYTFPEPPASTPPARLQTPQPQNISGDKFNFEIIKLGNGFVLNLSQGKSFIFKSREDLIEIFDEIIFDEKEIINEGLNGRKKTKKV